MIKVTELTLDPWIKVTQKQPDVFAIVFMYSKSNKEYSFGHFVLSRGGVKTTHWQPLIPPKDKRWTSELYLEVSIK